MTPIVKYQCDICMEKYDDYVEALRCEGKGQPDKTRLPPLGTIIGSEPGENYDGFIWVVTYIGVDKEWKHGLKIGVATFRGNGCGDDDLAEAMGKYGRDHFHIGTSKYGSYTNEGPDTWPEAYVCPAFERAVKAVRKLGIEPHVVRDGKYQILNEAGIGI